MVFGLDHPETLRAEKDLGITYSKEKKWEEAELLLSSVVTRSIEIIGQGHPDTQHRIAWLIRTYKNQDKMEQAEETSKLLILDV